MVFLTKIIRHNGDTKSYGFMLGTHHKGFLLVFDLLVRGSVAYPET